MNSSIDKEDNNPQELRKFLFNENDFSSIGQAELEEDEQKFTEEELESAKKNSFNSGKSAGLEESKQSQEAEIIKILEKMSLISKELIEKEKERSENSKKATIRLIATVITKIAPSIIKKTATESIEDLIGRILEERYDEPRLVIRVHANLLEALRQHIDDIAKEHGFDGQIILLAEDNILETDCKIEWADGGVERSINDFVEKIETEIIKVLGEEPVEKLEPVHDRSEPKTEEPIEQENAGEET